MPEKLGTRLTFGFIAVDVTKVAYSHNGLTLGWTTEHSRDVIQRELIRVADQVGNFPLFRDCRTLLGYWLQIHLPTLIMHPTQMATRFSSCHIFREDMSPKGQRAVRSFQGIFEGASKGDSRETPPRRKTLRGEVCFPKGSLLFLEPDILREFLERGTVQERDRDSTVAHVTIDGRRHEFSFFELRLLLDNLDKNWKDLRCQDSMAVMCYLVARMYAQRFPYEETNPEPGS